MSKAESKTKGATMITGKAKDVIKDPKDLKVFGGKPEDNVISIKLPNKPWREVDDATAEEFAKSMAKVGAEWKEKLENVDPTPEQLAQAKDFADLALKTSPAVVGNADMWGIDRDNLKVYVSEPGEGSKEVFGKEKAHALKEMVDPWGPGAGSLGGRRVTDLPQGDELPTERQIRNAEKIMKAAGLDLDSKISEAVSNALEKVQATGTFIFEGVLQEPIETGLKVDYNRISSVHLDNAFYLPHPVAQMYADKVFSLYLLRTAGSEAYYLLDGNSTVTLGGGEVKLSFHAPRSVPCRGVLVLINSSSNEDVVIGESALINTESAHNVLNNSVLARTKEPSPDYCSEFYKVGEAVPVKDIKERLNIKECQFKRTSVFDSVVTKGVYRDSQIRDSKIFGVGYTTVTTSQLMDANIRGTRVLIKGAHLDKTSITAEGELLVKYSRFTGAHIRASSIYIPNKFNYLEVDTPQHKLYFVRSTVKDFDIGTQTYSMERMRLDVDEVEIRKLVASQMSADHEGFATRPSMLTRSIASYLTDSIRSRLRVIRLLDEAKQLVREVGATTQPWDDIYAV